MTESRGKPEKGESSPEGPVPKAVVNRLSLYLREIELLVREGNDTTSSSQLGRLLGFTDAQVRKDLAYFGHFGYPGVGYRCDELIVAIRKILGTDQQWPVVLIGVGNLGNALLGYKGFQQRGFRMIAAFDTDTGKVGTDIQGVHVHHLDTLAEFAKSHPIRLGMIAVPSAAAQIVADRLVAAGVEGILNFAPITITLPDRVRHIGVDLAIELEQLSFSVVNRAGEES